MFNAIMQSTSCLQHGFSILWFYPNHYPFWVDPQAGTHCGDRNGLRYCPWRQQSGGPASIRVQVLHRFLQVRRKPADGGVDVSGFIDRYSVLPALTSWTALAISKVTVPVLRLGIRPRGPGSGPVYQRYPSYQALLWPHQFQPAFLLILATMSQPRRVGIPVPLLGLVALGNTSTVGPGLGAIPRPRAVDPRGAGPRSRTAISTVHRI